VYLGQNRLELAKYLISKGATIDTVTYAFSLSLSLSSPFHASFLTHIHTFKL